MNVDRQDEAPKGAAAGLGPHPGWEDRRLVGSCLRGDQRGWHALVDKYSRLVYAVILRAPKFGGRLRSFDAAPAEGVPGFLEALALPNGRAGLVWWELRRWGPTRPSESKPSQPRGRPCSVR